MGGGIARDETAGRLAAAAANPTLLDPIRASDAGCQARAEADDLDLAGLFGFATLFGEAREGLRAALLAMTRGSDNDVPD